MKAEITLALERPGSQIIPIMKVKIEPKHLTGFIDALTLLGRFLPLRAMMNGSVITGYDDNHDGLSLRGQPVELLTPND